MVRPSSQPAQYILYMYTHSAHKQCEDLHTYLVTMHELDERRIDLVQDLRFRLLESRETLPSGLHASTVNRSIHSEDS